MKLGALSGLYPENIVSRRFEPNLKHTPSLINITCLFNVQMYLYMKFVILK